MALIFVTAMFALPLWEFISRKYNKRLAYAVGIAFWAVVQILLITVSPSVPQALIYFLCVMAGIGISAAHVLPWAILPDAVEWDEYQTGERHEGMFYSLVTLMGKIASSVSIPLTALMLDLTNYVPNAVQQPASAVLGIRLLVGPIPAVFLTFGIIFALKYPLDRAQFSSVVKELHERREKA
jgi:GPH family glycoside/pentoside/hexuronide:cation symporter